MTIAEEILNNGVDPVALSGKAISLIEDEETMRKYFIFQDGSILEKSLLGFKLKEQQ